MDDRVPERRDSHASSSHGMSLGPAPARSADWRTIIDMQSWCRTWPPNGSSRIRAEQKLLRKHKGACKSSWSRIGNQKPLTPIFPRNPAKPVKIFPGIIVRLRHTDQKQMGLVREQCAE